MEKYNIDRDISLFYKQATSFPMGVGGAFAALQALLPQPDGRLLYGISNPNKDGAIIYRAATEEAYPGEGREKACETFLVRKGSFISLYLANWKKDESGIGQSFRKLLSYPGIDPMGYCLEIYENNNDVRCLVPLTR
ncbi:MAG TPA: hypothetical protein VNS58_32250 [Puia sp.]|nr:hypothetical protein [Puia sp.]